MGVNGFNNQFLNVRFKTLIPEKGQEDNTPIVKSVPGTNAREPLTNQGESMEVQYDMNGIMPSNGAPSNARPLQRLNLDVNYSTPRDTYLTKDEVQCKFSQDEIEKYFDYKFVYESKKDNIGIRQNMFLAFVIKNNLEINGVRITTIDQLLQVLGRA